MDLGARRERRYDSVLVNASGQSSVPGSPAHFEATPLGHVRALDGLRGVAIGLVLLHHAQLMTAGNGGAAGVSLFFVLSGFLITSLLIEERAAGSISLWRFYARRALRLFPVFGIVIVASALMLAVSGESGEALRVSLGAASYVGNWIMIGGSWLGPMSHTWSLAIEEQFYLLWPFVVLILWPFLSRQAALLLLLAAILATLVRLMLLASGETGRLAFGTDTQADGILIGAAVAFARWHGRLSFPWWAPLLALAMILFIAWRVGPSGFYFLSGQSLVVVASGVLVGSAATRLDRLTHAVLTWRPLRALGLVSYGAYLWHYPIMWQLDVLNGTPSLALSLVTIIGSIALALITYVLVERPVARWRHERWSVGHTAAAASATAHPVPATVLPD